MNNECPICCNIYTEHVRKKVSCLYCHHDCCRSCVSQYVLSVSTSPHCMACRKEWNYEFMYRNMSKSFILETFKKHTEHIMIERERALLPITQPIIERIHKIHSINVTIYNINNMILVKRFQERDALVRLRTNHNELVSNGLRMKHTDIVISETFTDSDQSDDERQQIRKMHAKLPIRIQENIRERNTLRRELKYLQEERRANDIIIGRLYQKNERRKQMIHEYYNTGIMNTEYVTESDSDEIQKDKSKKKRQFIRKCPSNNCKGFLNHNWLCGICCTRVCSRCHDIIMITDEHVCNNDNIATAEMIMKDTKNCPQCGVQIYKIDGCNMMFCTQCHTPFCWKTGNIIKNERIHNPHYYEWLRHNSKDGTIPREQGDDPCMEDNMNNRISIRSLRTVLKQCGILYYDMEDMLWNVHRVHVHIEMVEIPRLRNFVIDNTDLRIRYMLNDYTDKKWMQEMYKRKKRVDKNTAIGQIYEMVNAVIKDELYRLLLIVSPIYQHIFDCVSSLENLRIYANSQFLEISKLYQCKVPMLQEGTWAITSQKADTRIRQKNSYKGDSTTRIKLSDKES